MKLVGYQQPTCLCAVMEFVVRTISLSCELYALSLSCLRSCGVGTIMYGKWCFDLRMKCCGSCIVSREFSTWQYTSVIASTVAFMVSPVNNNASSHLTIFTSICWI